MASPVKEVRVWSSYFDQTLSRKYGRRLPRELSVPDPKPTEVLEACKSLGYECEIEEKRYPRAWYKPSALVVVRVPRDVSKYEVVKSIGRRLVEMRAKSR